MTTCFGTVRPGIPGAGHQLVIKKMTFALCRCLIKLLLSLLLLLLLILSF